MGIWIDLRLVFVDDHYFGEGLHGPEHRSPDLLSHTLKSEINISKFQYILVNYSKLLLLTGSTVVQESVLTTQNCHDNSGRYLGGV